MNGGESMTIRRGHIRSLVLAFGALAVSATIVAASQPASVLTNASSNISSKLQTAATHVSQPAALMALANAGARAQAGLAKATTHSSTHTSSSADAISLGTRSAAGVRFASRPTTPATGEANENATGPLDAIAAAGAAADAGLAKAGDALNNNPTSSDANAWKGINTATAAIDAGLAKAADAVGSAGSQANGHH
jgi:hypothetical protein